MRVRARDPLPPGPAPIAGAEGVHATTRQCARLSWLQAPAGRPPSPLRILAPRPYTGLRTLQHSGCLTRASRLSRSRDRAGRLTRTAAASGRRLALLAAATPPVRRRGPLGGGHVPVRRHGADAAVRHRRGVARLVAVLRLWRQGGQGAHALDAAGPGDGAHRRRQARQRRAQGHPDGRCTGERTQSEHKALSTQSAASPLPLLESPNPNPDHTPTPTPDQVNYTKHCIAFNNHVRVHPFTKDGVLEGFKVRTLSLMNP